jgi:hypothetical protein
VCIDSSIESRTVIAMKCIEQLCAKEIWRSVDSHACHGFTFDDVVPRVKVGRC